ncbi:MAG: hypothetical protein ACYDD9_06185 [Acidithiobacillus sp.]
MKKDMRPAEIIIEERRKCAYIYRKRILEKKKIEKCRRTIEEYEAKMAARGGVKMSAKEEAGIV